MDERNGEEKFAGVHRSDNGLDGFDEDGLCVVSKNCDGYDSGYIDRRSANR